MSINNTWPISNLVSDAASAITTTYLLLSRKSLLSKKVPGSNYVCPAWLLLNPRRVKPKLILERRGCTYGGNHLTALAALRVVRVPIMTARNEDVRGERVVVGFHCGEFGFNLTHRRGEPFECLLKACNPPRCSSEHHLC